MARSKLMSLEAAAGLVPDGPVMREKPVAFIIHGGPGGDHSGFKPVMSPLAETAQLVYFDHRGQGRSGLAEVRQRPPEWLGNRWESA